MLERLIETAISSGRLAFLSNLVYDVTTIHTDGVPKLGLPGYPLIVELSVYGGPLNVESSSVPDWLRHGGTFDAKVLQPRGTLLWVHRDNDHAFFRTGIRYPCPSVYWDYTEEINFSYVRDGLYIYVGTRPMLRVDRDVNVDIFSPMTHYSGYIIYDDLVPRSLLVPRSILVHGSREVLFTLC